MICLQFVLDPCRWVIIDLTPSLSPLLPSRSPFPPSIRDLLPIKSGGIDLFVEALGGHWFSVTFNYDCCCRCCCRLPIEIIWTMMVIICIWVNFQLIIIWLQAKKWWMCFVFLPLLSLFFNTYFWALGCFWRVIFFAQL